MKKKNGFTLIELLIVIALIGIGASMLFSGVQRLHTGGGPTRNPKAEMALSNMGFSNVSLGSLPFGMCGKDDSWWNSYGFMATNPAGRNVSGAVCCGYWKGCTVRF